MKSALAVLIGVSIVCAAGAALAQAELKQAPEPFGLKAGMTESQVLALVGEEAVEKETSDALALSTAPKPCNDCEIYILIFSPEQGLVKVAAFTRSIKVDDEGDELRHEFDKIEAAVADKNGTPEMIDFARNEADSEYWMMSLYKKERTLEANWNYGEGGRGGKGGSTETGIYLQAVASAPNEGHVVVVYEFPGWKTYANSLQAK